MIKIKLPTRCYFDGNFFTRHKTLVALYQDWGLPMPASQHTAATIAASIQCQLAGVKHGQEVALKLPPYITMVDAYLLCVGFAATLVGNLAVWF